LQVGRDELARGGCQDRWWTREESERGGLESCALCLSFSVSFFGVRCEEEEIDRVGDNRDSTWRDRILSHATAMYHWAFSCNAHRRQQQRVLAQITVGVR